MSEEESPKTWEDISRNNFKTVTPQQIEEAIAAAVGELLGVKLVCHIGNIKFTGRIGNHGAAFDVSLSEPLEKMFGPATEGKVI